MTQNIQLEVVQNLTSCQWCPPNQKPGNKIWVSETQAEHLIANGLCRYLAGGPGVAPVDPAERKLKPLRRPQGWPMDRFAVIEPAWKDEIAVCIGGGPGATVADVEAVRGRARVVAINNSYLLAPWAELLYFADFRWWEWHQARPEFQQFAGQKVTIKSTGGQVSDPEIFMLQNYGTDGLSEKPNGLHTGCNGGYQAINIAALAGARKILLLGYDMRFPGGKSHWHQGHPIRIPEAHYTHYARFFAGMLPQLKKLGIEVVNCTPGSAIPAYRFGELETELRN